MYLTLQEVPRTDFPSGRIYHTPVGDLPSVTSVLGQTADDEWLKEWAQRVGLAEAERIRDEAADIGTKMHGHIEDLLLRKPERVPTDKNDAEGLKLARQAAWTSLRRVKLVRATECVLYSAKYGFAGSCDLVCDWAVADCLAIVDHKSSRGSKEKAGDYALQVAGYAVAHDEMYPELGPVQCAVVSITSRYGKSSLFVLRGEELAEAKRAWFARLATFLEASLRSA